MAITRTVLAATPYMLKYLLTHNQVTDTDVLTITNAQLLADMELGPLRDLFVQTGMTQAQARAGTTEGPNMDAPFFVFRTAGSVGAPEDWGCDVTVDGSGLPQVRVVGDPLSSPVILQLSFRHSTGR